MESSGEARNHSEAIAMAEAVRARRSRPPDELDSGCEHLLHPDTLLATLKAEDDGWRPTMVRNKLTSRRGTIGYSDKFSYTPRKQIHARRAFEKGMQVTQVSKDERKPEVEETDEMTAGDLGGTVKNVWDLLTSGSSDGMLLHPDSMRQMKVASPPPPHKFAKQFC